MKKIGFVDYYISEYHANNYPNWIKEVCEKTGLNYQVCYAYAELDTSLIDGKDTDTWCKQFGVERCYSIEELCQKSDYIMVLSPSFPETHLRLTEQAFPCGKRSYVDKTFAPDLQTAKEIFACAEKYGVSFFSTSALRYADEVCALKGVNNISVKGGGRAFEEYVIHQIEIVVATLGVGATQVKVDEIGENEYMVDILFNDDRHAKLHYEKSFNFEIATQTGEEKKVYEVNSAFFKNLTEKILYFFETGEVDFKPTDTLEVMKIRDACILGKQQQLSKWIKIEK